MKDQKAAQVSALKSLVKHMHGRMSKEEKMESESPAEDNPAEEVAEAAEASEGENPLEEIKHIFRPEKSNKKPAVIVSMSKSKFNKKKK